MKDNDLYSNDELKLFEALEEKIDKGTYKHTCTVARVPLIGVKL